MKFVGRIAIALAATLLILAAAQNATASLQLSFDSDANGTPDLLVEDNVSAADINPTGNEIAVLNYMAGGWKISMTVGSSTSPGGSPPEIFLSSVTIKNVSAGNGKSIVLEVSDNDFVIPLPTIAVHAMLNLMTLNPGTTVAYTGFIAASNVEFDKTELATPTLSLTSAGVVQASAGPFSYQDAYSLTGKLVVTTNQGQEVNISGGKTWTTPEPATLAIWSLLGVAGVMFARRRRTLA